MDTIREGGYVSADSHIVEPADLFVTRWIDGLEIVRHALNRQRTRTAV